MPGDKGWKSTPKTVETLPQEEKGSIHVGEQGELHFSEEVKKYTPEENEQEGPRCSEEFIRYTDPQIAIQLGSLGLFGDKKQVLEHLKKDFGFLEDEGKYLKIKEFDTPDGRHRTHIQLISPRGILIDSKYGVREDFNHIIEDKKDTDNK